MPVAPLAADGATSQAIPVGTAPISTIGVGLGETLRPPNRPGGFCHGRCSTMLGLRMRRPLEPPLSSRPPIFCVFSYNRGRFLKHCVATIETCSPASRIVIFDDHSNDGETVGILDELRARHEVCIPEGPDDFAHKCGGLYANMQRALESLPANQLACFIQDDMQVVRRLDEKDLAAFERFFAADPNAAFLQPALMRASHRDRDERITAYDPDVGVYFRSNNRQSAGIFFSAVSILHPGRLRAAGWTFAPTEKQNEAQARRHFSRLGLLRDPFVFYLPSVPAYRGKAKTWALAYAEKIRRCGFYPYRLMSDAEIVALRQRDPKVLPIAEDLLRTEDPTIEAPWIFYPIEGSSVLKALNTLELRLRAAWRALHSKWS